jgi:pimeloyl-ACP methyl ester carboxylesterase
MRTPNKAKVCSKILICLSLQALTHCGKSQDPHSELSETRDSKTTLFTYFGGNTSCGKDANGNSPSPYGQKAWSEIYNLLKAHNTETTKVEYIISCYTDKADVILAHSRRPGEIFATDTEGFADFVAKYVEAIQPDRTVLAGHSYGGWLAMKVSELQGDRIPNHHLHTVDPISRKTCSFSSPFGCQSAPEDFSSSERADLADRSDLWINYFQTQTWYLHSSAIREADQNYKFKTSHTDIDSAAQVWESMSRSILTPDDNDA